METGVWHTVLVSRTGREVYLTVDGVEGDTVSSPGGFSQLSLAQEPTFIHFKVIYYLP